MALKNDEAIAILKRLGAELQPTAVYKDREAAAGKLLESVLDAAKQAGFEVAREHGLYVVILPRSGAAHLTVADDKLVLSVQGPPPRTIPLAIAYDGAVGMFVGTDDDDAYVPVPGQLKKAKRNAVTVVIEAIAKDIRVQHEARKAAR